LNGIGLDKKSAAVPEDQAMPRAELGKIAETMILKQGE